MKSSHIKNVVIDWYASPGNNYGVLLRYSDCVNDYNTIYSSDYRPSGSTAYIPYLAVSYVDIVPVSQVCLSHSSMTLDVDVTSKLSAQVVPSNASNKWIYFSSDNESVATVSSSGLISARSKGTAVITARSAADSSKFATCTVMVGEVFDYSSTQYSRDLALLCAEYSLLAYDEMIKESDSYTDSKKRAETPTLLNTTLAQDGYTDIINRNYGDENPHNVSYTLAHKEILYNGGPRTLVAVVIRGTDGEEWKGNMDLTGTSYDASMTDHYSFKQAEIDLRTNTANEKTSGLEK